MLKSGYGEAEKLFTEDVIACQTTFGEQHEDTPRAQEGLAKAMQALVEQVEQETFGSHAGVWTTSSGSSSLWTLLGLLFEAQTCPVVCSLVADLTASMFDLSFPNPEKVSIPRVS